MCTSMPLGQFNLIVDRLKFVVLKNASSHVINLSKEIIKICRLHCDFFLCQAVQVEKKEAEEEKGGEDKVNNKEKEEEAVLEKENKEKEQDKEGEEEKEKEEEKEDEKESGPEGCSKGEKDEKLTDEKAKAPRGPRRPKTMQIKVTLLDNALFECELDVRSFAPFFFHSSRTSIMKIKFQLAKLFMFKTCIHMLLLEVPYPCRSIKPGFLKWGHSYILLFFKLSMK